jgi:hypothetical protein
LTTRRAPGFALLFARWLSTVGALASFAVCLVECLEWTPAAVRGVLAPPLLGQSLVLGVLFISIQIPVGLSIRRRLKTATPVGIDSRPGNLRHLFVNRLDASRPAGAPRGGTLVFWETFPYVAVDASYARLPALGELYVRKESVRFRYLERPLLLGLLRAVDGTPAEFPLFSLLPVLSHHDELARSVHQGEADTRPPMIPVPTPARSRLPTGTALGVLPTRRQGASGGLGAEGPTFEH